MPPSNHVFHDPGFEFPDGVTERHATLSLRFRHKPFYRPLAEACGVSEGGAAVMLDLHAEATGANRDTSYSATKAWWEKRPVSNPVHTYRKIIQDGINPLAADGWIEDHRREFVKGEIGWQSHMRATPKLIDAVDAVIRIVGHNPKPVIPDDVIIIRDKNRKLLPVPDTQKIRRRRAQLEAWNRFMEGQDIGGGTACVVRIANEHEDRVSRLYALGGAWQNMKKTERRALRIDDEECFEVDYSSMHPSMLYVLAGLQPPADCYAVEWWPRALAKVALNTILNARTYGEGFMAILHCDLMKKAADENAGFANNYVSDLIGALRRMHRPIEHYFFTGVGATLMFREAEICQTVMTRMASKGIVVLPIHDSFLVRASLVDVLEETMLQVAFEAGLSAILIRRKASPTAA